MGTLTKSKAAEVFNSLGNHLSVTFKKMLESDVYDENDLKEVIDAEIKKDSTSKDYLNNVSEVAGLTYEDLENQAERFDYSSRLEDRIDNELEKVDVKKTEKSDKTTEKEDRQKIR